jgi:hypothetical protein
MKKESKKNSTANHSFTLCGVTLKKFLNSGPVKVIPFILLPVPNMGIPFKWNVNCGRCRASTYSGLGGGGAAIFAGAPCP